MIRIRDSDAVCLPSETRVRDLDSVSLGLMIRIRIWHRNLDSANHTNHLIIDLPTHTMRDQLEINFQ